VRHLLAILLALLLVLAAARPATAHLHTAADHQSVAHVHAPLEHPHADEGREGAHHDDHVRQGHAQSSNGDIVFFKLTPTAPKPSFKVPALLVEAYELRVDSPLVGAAFLSDPIEPVPPRFAPLPGRAPPSSATP
jgi:hypothetical protein